jgi:hypothetical protein
MSKGKSRAARPLPELPDGVSTTSTDLQSTPKGSGNRLPSLRPKRDLTLGGSPPPRTSKKTFAPTIPVRRKKVATAPVVPPVPDGSTSPQERGKGRERRERGRGRGRRDRDIVTSASVFSMGPAEKLMQKRESTGEIFGSFSRSERSERSDRSERSESSAKVKKGEPDNRYHLHYSDEEKGEEERGGVASAEGGHMMFRDSKLPPIQLPLDYSVHSRHRAVTTKNKIVKVEVEEDASGPPTGPVKLVKPVREPGASTQSHPERMTAAKLFTPSEGSKGQFLFFQLPDCLPLERDDVAMDTSVTPPIQSTAASSATTTPAEKRDDEVFARYIPRFDGPSLSHRPYQVLGIFLMDILVKSECMSRAKSSKYYYMHLHNTRLKFEQVQFSPGI